MSNVKITEVAVSDITREMFENKSSYSRFIKGFNLLKELQEKKDAGYIILHRGMPVKEDFIFGFDYDNKLPKIGTGNSSCMVMWLGATYGLIDDTTYVEKEEMDIFKDICYVEPKNIKKVKLS